MTKQPEDWLDDVPGDDIEDEDDEIIWVSKSEIKRDAEELKQLGGEIITIGSDAHDPSAIAGDFDRAADVLRECGFSYYTTFENRIADFHCL